MSGAVTPSTCVLCSLDELSHLALSHLSLHPPALAYREQRGCTSDGRFPHGYYWSLPKYKLVNFPGMCFQQWILLAKPFTDGRVHAQLHRALVARSMHFPSLM